MWLIEVCRAAATRFVENLSTPLEKERGGLPMEEDPVGDFLARKEAVGGDMEDDEALETEASDAAEEDLGSGSGVLSAPEEAPAALVEKTFEQEPVEQIALPVSELEDVGAGDGDSWMEDTSEEDRASEEVETETELVVLSAEEMDTQEDGAETTIVDEPVSGIVVQKKELEHAEAEGEAEPQEDEGVDDLLEVFRSEELIENSLGDLSRDMEDVSVYSLLEDIRSIADRVKRKR